MVLFFLSSCPISFLYSFFSQSLFILHNRYKIECIVEDETEESKLLLVGRATNFLQLLLHLWFNMEIIHQFCLQKQRICLTRYIFQVEFGDPKYNYARNDILIKNIVDVAALDADEIPASHNLTLRSTIAQGTSSSISQQLKGKGIVNFSLDTEIQTTDRYNFFYSIYQSFYDFS